MRNIKKRNEKRKKGNSFRYNVSKTLAVCAFCYVCRGIVIISVPQRLDIAYNKNAFQTLERTEINMKACISNCAENTDLCAQD